MLGTGQVAAWQAYLRLIAQVMARAK